MKRKEHARELRGILINEIMLQQPWTTLTKHELHREETKNTYGSRMTNPKPVLL